MDLLYTLIVGAVAGWLGGLLWKGSGFGLLGDIVIGIIGGWVGGLVAGMIGIFGHGLIGRILIAAAGAWIILFVISKLKRK